MDTISTTFRPEDLSELCQVDDLNLCAAMVTLGFRLHHYEDFTELDTSSQNVTGRNGVRQCLWKFHARSIAGKSFDFYRFSYRNGLPKEVPAFDSANPIPAMRVALLNYLTLRFASTNSAPLYLVPAGIPYKASIYPSSVPGTVHPPCFTTGRIGSAPASHIVAAVALTFGCPVIAVDPLNQDAPYILAPSKDGLQPSALSALSRDNAALSDSANQSPMAYAFAFLINRSRLLHLLATQEAKKPLLRADAATAAVIHGSPANLPDSAKRAIAAHLGL